MLPTPPIAPGASCATLYFDGTPATDVDAVAAENINGAGAGFTVCDGLGVGTPVGASDAGGTTGAIVCDGFTVCDGLGVGTGVGVEATSALHASSTTTPCALASSTSECVISLVT